MFLLALRPDTNGPWTSYPPVIRIYELSGNFGSETLVFRTNAVAPLTWPQGRGAPAGQQAGTPQLIHILEKALDGVIYRNGTLWTVHEMFPYATNNQTDIQWWQITTNGQVLQFGRIEDPTGTNCYGFPSIAVNKFNDVFIGYSRFSPLAFISDYYTFHASTDPTYTLRGEALLKAGEAPYTTSGNTNVYDILQWGDYSQTVVDPVNDTDFWTIQQYATIGVSFNYGLWWGRFVPPGAWPVFLAQQRSNFNFRLTFSTSPGNSYSLLGATNLSSAPWQTLQTNLTGTGNPLQFTVTNTFPAPQRFFRLRIDP
jgi:hypothetical protein